MKRVWVIFVGLMISVLLGGCKSKIIKPDPKQSGEISQQTGAYQFSEQEKTDNELQTIVSVVDLVDDFTSKKSLTTWAAEVTKDDRSVKVTYEHASGDKETYRQQILAELSEGKGPDLLYVTPDDFLILQSKGSIENLDIVLDENILEAVWPAVIGLGSVDGKLYGMAGEITAMSMLLPSAVPGYEHWTPEDMVRLMESGKIESNIFYEGAGCYFAPLASMRLITPYFELIDMEKGISCFDDSVYIRFLMSLGYEQKKTEQQESLFGKENRAVFIDFSDDIVEKYPTEVFHNAGYFAGLPSKNGAGNYMKAQGFLVVNKKSGQKEKIKYFLDSFWKKEENAVFDVGISAYRYNRNDIELVEDDIFYWHGQKIEALSDGRTSLDVVIEFLDSCVPSPRLNAEIETILMEEAEEMFRGKKNPRDVANIINNRVQLYLDER